MNISTRLGAGLAGVAATATIAVFAAPQAAATVNSITVSGSATYTINTQYDLTAKLGGAGIGLLVYWSDNGKDISGPKVPWPVGEAHFSWTPTTAGQHLITCSQGGSTKTLIVNVIDPSQPGGGTGGGDGTGDGGGTGSGSSALGGLLGALTGSAGS